MKNGSSDAPSKRRSAWDNPSIPVGDAPLMPRWPLVLITLAWASWVVFLAAMALSRTQVAAT